MGSKYYPYAILLSSHFRSTFGVIKYVVTVVTDADQLRCGHRRGAETIGEYARMGEDVGRTAVRHEMADHDGHQ